MPALAVGLEALSKGVEVAFDARKQQKILCFNLALQVPLDDLLQAVASNEPGLGLKGGISRTDELERQRLPEAADKPSAWTDLEAPRKVELTPDRGSAASPKVAEFDGLLQLEHSVRSGDVAAVKSFIRTQQGEFLKIANRPVDNLLSLGLQSYRRLDMVKELIQGRCSANSVTEDGRSPLHWAVSEVDSISPIVTRLLLCSRADHLQRDNRQLTPVDCLKSRAARPDVSSNVKQIMSELLEHPTQQVAVIEKERVLSACFADASCETVAFHTDSAVGFYSLRSAEVTMRKVLSKPKAKSGLRGMAVHRARGTLAVLVELTGNTPAKEMVIVWPRGQLEDEEPLQWCVQAAKPSPESAKQGSTSCEHCSQSLAR
ncbi:unnamed protein product [Effrenium voratum]|nr:unnamed protein product [Effrenium voratum]